MVLGRAHLRRFVLMDLQSHVLVWGYPYQYLWHPLKDCVGDGDLIGTPCDRMLSVGFQRGWVLVTIALLDVDGSPE